MSKFKDFLLLQEKLGGGFDWRPSASSNRTLGIDPGLGQLDKPPVGGWNNVQDFARWKANQMKGGRLFDLNKLAEKIKVPTDKTQIVIEKYSSVYGSPFSYAAAETFLRELKQRTDSARMVLASAGTTPSDPDLSARLKGAHFKGQGARNTGNEKNVDQSHIQDLDKRLYTGEVSGRGGGVGAFEIGEALYAITPSGERTNGVQGRYDVNVKLIERAVLEFSQMESDFTRKIAYGLLGAGAITKAGTKILAPSTGTQQGGNIDAFNQGASSF